MKRLSAAYFFALWTFLIFFVFRVKAPKYAGNQTNSTTSFTFHEIPDPFRYDQHATEQKNEQFKTAKAESTGTTLSKVTKTHKHFPRVRSVFTHWDISVNLSLISTDSCQQINETTYATDTNKITIFPKTSFKNADFTNILKIPNSTYGVDVEDLDGIISKTIQFQRSSSTNYSLLTLYFLMNTNETGLEDEPHQDNVIFRCYFAINDTAVIEEILPRDEIFWWKRKPNRNVSLTFRFFAPYDSGDFNLRRIVEDIDRFVEPSYCSSKIPFFYSLVISGDLKRNAIFLSFINANYILSTFSLLLIFLTAKLSMEWRQRRSNIILINFTVAIFSQIILHFISDFTEVDEGLCTSVTVLCHYFTLVQFLWTTTIAYMQYRRYVQVFDDKDGFFMIKLILFAWVTPMIIISISLIVVFSIGENSKNCQDKFKMCSLINTYLLKYCVAVPLLFTLMTNFIFFIMIFRHLLSRKLEYDQKTGALLEAKLAFVLFFLLDINLIVAIIADMFSIDILASIFVTSHSLQGVLLFVVFVVRNKCSRKMYVRWIKIAYDRCVLTKC